MMPTINSRLSPREQFIIFIWFFAYIVGIPYHVFPLTFVAGGLVGLLIFPYLRSAYFAYSRKDRFILFSILFAVVIRLYISLFLGKSTEKFNAAHLYFIINYFIFGYLSLKGPKSLKWAAKSIVIILLLSAFYHLLFAFINQPFSNLWESMYRSRPVLSDEIITTYGSVKACGLTSWAHLYGYQMAALLPILFVFLMVSKKINLIYWIGLFACLTSIFILGQRSVVVSLVVVYCYLTLKLFNKKRNLKISTLIAVFVFILFSANSFYSSDVFKSIKARTSDNRIKYESVARFELQKITLTILVQNPEGLVWSEESYGDHAFKYNPIIFSAWGRDIASHNGYLTFAVQLGWAAAVLVIFVVYRMIRIANDLLINYQKQGIFGVWSLAIPLSFISLLVNALGHNASLFSLETTTVLIAMLMISMNSMIPNPNNAEKR
jgi:hypothetical protein